MKRVAARSRARLSVCGSQRSVQLVLLARGDLLVRRPRACVTGVPTFGDKSVEVLGAAALLGRQLLSCNALRLQVLMPWWWTCMSVCRVCHALCPRQ
jgi:hypothetical protein